MPSPLSLNRHRPTEPWPGVVVVGGGKGGVGTSTVAALLALASARLGARTLLVEAVHGVSVLPLLFGREAPAEGLLTRGGPDVRALREEVAPGLTLLPGGGTPDELSSSRQGERAARVRRAASLYDEHEMTVVDAGCRLDEVLGAVSVGAERMVVVASSSRIALAGAHALFKSVLLRGSSVRLELLLNGCDEAVARDAFDLTREAGRRFLGQGPAHAGTLPRAPELEEGRPAREGLQAVPPEAPVLASASRVVRRWHEEQRRAREEGAPVIPLAGTG
jgi:MinD-like ATPase involved in chromosome partitioning or flagellar assembly